MVTEEVIWHQSSDKAFNTSTIQKRTYDIALVLRAIGYVQFEKKHIWTKKNKKPLTRYSVFINTPNFRTNCIAMIKNRVIKKGILVSKLRQAKMLIKKFKEKK
jgi:hypothetical protein